MFMTWVLGFLTLYFQLEVMFRSPPSIKKIEKTVRETLNEAQNANEKRAWGDQVAVGESIDEEFHTHVGNLMKDNIIFTP
jgi:AICAR transformylase/IMP cyclohydrolase PurH